MSRGKKNKLNLIYILNFIQFSLKRQTWNHPSSISAEVKTTGPVNPRDNSSWWYVSSPHYDSSNIHKSSRSKQKPSFLPISVLIRKRRIKACANLRANASNLLPIIFQCNTVVELKTNTVKLAILIIRPTMNICAPLSFQIAINKFLLICYTQIYITIQKKRSVTSISSWLHKQIIFNQTLLWRI